MSTPVSHVAVLGAGASILVTDLIAAGYRSIEAIDISSAALARLAAELGDDAEIVACRVADVRTVAFERPVDVWHDRAVFHFLTSVGDQAAYAANASMAVRAGGVLIIATFAPDGPEQCSGLPVARHSAASLQAAFGAAFDLTESFERDHRTPWGSVQRFTHAVFVHH